MLARKSNLMKELLSTISILIKVSYKKTDKGWIEGKKVKKLISPRQNPSVLTIESMCNKTQSNTKINVSNIVTKK